MQFIDGNAVFSATDLNNFLECRRLTELDALVARHVLQRPEDDDEQAALIRRKGDEHEARYLERLQSAGLVVTFERTGSGIEAYRAAERRTLEAMRSGAPTIFQATFFDGRFVGHADFLRRVDTPSSLGAWSYEVIDTKLALSPKPYFLVQLSNYSEHLERLQGLAPRHGYIVLGNGEEQSFLMHDFAAYYRHLKSTFVSFVEAAHDRTHAQTYPLRRGHCRICPWDAACRRKRVADDHLSLVASMRRDQIAKFEESGISTVAALAAADDAAAPRSMHGETFLRLRRQAALQMRGRGGGVYYELLDHEVKAGFGMLPEPDAGDVFFDMEGDPLFEPGKSLEYLFGAWAPADDPPFHAFWALNRDDEKRALEAFVDYIVDRRKRYPKMHVYHYANYEKAALRRLAQAHATREAEVDGLLRAEVLVDLYAVVRQAIAISEDSYSIKRFEKFYGLTRDTDVKKGDASIVMFERWMLEGDRSILEDIERYNRDDCRSTFLLREWLLERRAEAQRTLGLVHPFREPKEPDALPEDDTATRTALEAEILRDVPAVVDEHVFAKLDDGARARYLLASALQYHRREEKPVWWAFFDRCDNIDDLLDLDRDAIAGLKYAHDIEPRREKRSFIYTYRIPEQRYKLGVGESVCDPAMRDSCGSIFAIDEERGILELKWTGDAARAQSIAALIPGGPHRTDAQKAALLRLALKMLDGTFERDHSAAADMLLGRPPNVRGYLPGMTIQPADVDAQSVSRLVQGLDRSYLFIQGPPGSGKTTTCAAVIADLLIAGKRVGVVSTGHKAIHHLLHKVEDAMFARKQPFRGRYKHTAEKPHSEFRSRLHVPFITSTSKNGDFDSLDFQLAGGTAWLFARPELCGAFDYLFIDEAGQVALPDALAVAACAGNVVLLGDPAQLAQVSQGVHPYRAGWSVLEHVLGDEPTISPDRGVFLDISYRMQPQICAFISEAMYDARLHPAPATENHHVRSDGLSGAGLRYIPVEHSGNDASSPQEAARIVEEIALLRRGFVTDDDGIERPMRDTDIIVVTPYNAQRKLLERRLREAGFEIPVGTVDKFQGQEAAVVFYSMATSSGDDVPRDVAFLFEQNRFNVAVSRARALSVLVCSPRLLDVPCTSPQQMAMINFLCDYVEKSTLPGRPGVSAASSADLKSLNG